MRRASTVKVRAIRFTSPIRTEIGWSFPKIEVVYTATELLSTRLRRATLLLQPRQHSLRREWRFAQAQANGVEDGVGNRCRNGDYGRLARAQRRHLGPVDQDNFDLRYVVEL